MVLRGTVVPEIFCREVREELTDYIDGDITPQFRARIESHLAACSSCREYYDSVRQVIRMLGETEPIELPAGFSQHLYSRLVNL